MQRAIAFGLLLCYLAGCASYGSKPAYVTLSDQVYITRGASEARLGSCGIYDTAGINSFERQFYDTELLDGVTKYVRAHIAVTITRDSSVSGKGSASYKVAAVKSSGSSDSKTEETFGIAVVDLHKDELIKKLNDDKVLKEHLIKSDSWRIVTATAVITGEYSQEKTKKSAFQLSAEEISKLATGTLEITDLQSINTKISPGSIYAYQMSHIGWDKAGENILLLKTDRPWTKDKFYHPKNIIYPANKTVKYNTLKSSK